MFQTPEQNAGTSANARLRDVDTHFAFGENWASYAKGIDDAKIESAVAAMRRLVGEDALRGRRFLDIGSGSGLHSLAATRLGVAEVAAFDIDPNSAATTRAVLGRFAAPAVVWRVEQRSVFDLDPAVQGRYDVVYSWGVLHHTGDMYPAMRRAAALVEPGGLFVFALYRKTSLCGFWKVEKRLYSKAPRWLQKLAQSVFAVAYRAAYWTSIGPRDKFAAFLAGYTTRGMDWYHDIHDWLGGYPYESISPAEVAALMAELGFEPVRQFVSETVGRAVLFGPGCDEYVYRRAQPTPEKA